MSDPTQILIAAARHVIAAVKLADMEVDVGSVLQSMTISCSGPGQFNLTIESAADINVERLTAEIQQLLESETRNE